jgi:hypothetical protein
MSGFEPVGGNAEGVDELLKVASCGDVAVREKQVPFLTSEGWIGAFAELR